MLYDPKRGSPSLAGFAAFAESKPSGASYNWNSPTNCAAAQYHKHLNGTADCWSRDGRYAPLNAIAFNARTFGELARLARLRLRAG
jgi:hypothetical protein